MGRLRPPRADYDAPDQAVLARATAEIAGSVADGKRMSKPLDAVLGLAYAPYGPFTSTETGIMLSIAMATDAAETTRKTISDWFLRRYPKWMISIQVTSGLNLEEETFLIGDRYICDGHTESIQGGFALKIEKATYYVAQIGPRQLMAIAVASVDQSELFELIEQTWRTIR